MNEKIFKTKEVTKLILLLSVANDLYALKIYVNLFLCIYGDTFQ